MLHILLLILKIIGIVLLVILGLLLAAVLLVLLVPLRYRLAGSWHGKPAGQAGVIWLFRAVSVLAVYENELDITAKLFGFKVFSAAFGGESEETDEAGEWDDEWNDESGGGTDGTYEAGDQTGDLSEGPDGQPAGTDDGSQEDGNNGTDISADEADVPDDGEIVGAMSLENDSGLAGASYAADSQAGEDSTEGIDISQLPTLEEELRQDEAEAADISSGDVSGQENPLAAGSSQNRDDQDQPAAEESSDDIIDRIETIFDTIGEKLEWADKKRCWVEHFLEDPKNQKTIRLVWRQVQAILRHILPQKATGQITFGFDDPATTGNILAACSVLYALYGTELTITPDFENAVIDGDLELKGRIRMGTLAVRAVRVLIDRNLWRMIKQVRKFLKSGGR